MLILSKPTIYSLELTPLCNNNCPGCSNLYADMRGPSILDLDAWEHILHLIGPDAVRIRLTGGEPTLHPSFNRIFDLANSYDALVTVFTNGRWQNPKELIALIHQHNQQAGLLISLHGSTAEAHEAFTHVPGSFKQTLNNLRLARSAGLNIAITTVLTRHNLHQIDDLVELAEKLEIEHIAFNRYLGRPSPDEPALEDLTRAFKRIEELIQTSHAVRYGISVPQCFMQNSSEGCLAGVAYAAIDPWGNLRPCSHSPTIAGSLFDHSIEELWFNPIMQHWRDGLQAECQECEALSICHGGCKANAELRQSKDPLCICPIRDYMPAEIQHDFPPGAHPVLQVRLRSESFGFSVMAAGQVMPVVTQARPVIEACDGSATFADIADRFGQDGLDLLGDLWDVGILKIADL